MKKLIQTIPPLLWSTVSLLPLIVYLAVPIEILTLKTLNHLAIVAYLCYALWISSLVEYMCAESKSTKYRLLVYATTALIIFFEILFKYMPSEDKPFTVLALLPNLSLLVLFIFNCFILTALVKRVFYARTTWFVFLELFMPPVGMFTLTKEVQNWEKEKNENASNQNNQRLNPPPCQNPSHTTSPYLS